MREIVINHLFKRIADLRKVKKRALKPYTFSVRGGMVKRKDSYAKLDQVAWGTSEITERIVKQRVFCIAKRKQLTYSTSRF